MNAKSTPTLTIQPGSKLVSEDRTYTVLRLVDLGQVLAREESSNKKVVLDLRTLSPPRHAEAASKSLDLSLDMISEDDWEAAEFRRTLLEPLLSPSLRSKGAYKAAAEQADVSVATIYRWLADYQSSGGLLSSLVPNRRPGGQGKSRLEEATAGIVSDVIQSFHLTGQKPSIEATVREARRRCSNAGIIPLPAGTTIRRHIEWISERERVERREGPRTASQRFDHNRGSIPDADWPLALVQMDHTLLPIIIVDEEHRLPINRAWITLAIDVFSRVCLGMYLTLDKPSAMSAGLCMSHAILPKEKWLERLDLKAAEWPFYGTMDVLHLDNAKEFRGNMLKTACSEYGIDIHFRPVKKPRFGAHIERLMGTLTQKLKEVPGSTFSNPRDKGDYDAEGNACMTLDEVEKWLVLMFAEYHNGIHTGIGTTPLARWSDGILGTKSRPPRGLPLRRSDEEKVRLDFMPYEERTIQDYGVVIDDVHYFHDALRPWIGIMEPTSPRLKRKFRFKRDPRDISEIYFFDPDLKRYVTVPYRDTSLPPCSIWEYRACQRLMAERGIKAYDERTVFAFMTERRALEDASSKKSKAARRANQSRVQNTKIQQHKKQLRIDKVEGPNSSYPDAIRGYDPSMLKPLTDD